MNRILLALVVGEAVVIVLLVTGALEGTPRAEPDRSGVAAAPDRARHVEAKENAPEPAPAPRSETCVLHGRLTDAASAPVTGVWITLTSEGKRTNHRPGESGYYAVSGLAPGTWEVHIGGQSYDEVRATLELNGPVVQRDFTLVRSLLVAIEFVTPEGEPLADAARREAAGLLNLPVYAVATRTPPGDRLPMTTLRTHHRFGVGEWQGSFGRPGAALKLKEGVPCYVSAVVKHHVLETRHVTEPVEKLRFVVRVADVLGRLATVRLKTVDAGTGEPVRARVSISNRQGTGMIPAVSPEDGVHVREFVEPGLLVLSVQCGAYESITHYLRVDGGEIDLGTLRMNKTVVVAGRVLGPDGKPVPAPANRPMGWRVTARNLDRMTFPQPLDTGHGAGVAKDGTFKIHGIGRGRYVVLCAVEGYALAAVAVDTTGGAAPSIDIRLQRGTDVTFRPELEATDQVLVTVRRDGAPVYGRFFSGAGNWSRTIPLAPGRYTVELADDQGLLRTETLEVGAAAATVVVRR